tara:strand:+ start:1087 stop:3810 length:2724 start_codon:yes stop_codon:yes gene_type:complete
MSLIKNSIQIYLPITAGGLSRQQFLNDVLCPQIQRGTTLATRSGLAKIIYDDFFDKSSVKELDSGTYKRIISGRQGTRDKIVSIHPNYHSTLEESHGSIKSSNLAQQAEYEEYMRFMSNIGTSELAAMTPFVKLIYRYKQKENDPWREFILPFKSFTTEQEFTSKDMISKFNRGDGAGITSVSVNRNFPGIGNILSVFVDISFFFQNLNILTRKQQLDGVKDFSLIKVMAFLPPKKEELVLEYGYGISRFTDPSIIPPRMQSQILLREKKRFHLKYKGHNFDLEQDGSVKLNVSYTTQQDQDLFDKNADVAIPKDKIQIASLGVSNSTKSLLNKYRKLLKTRDELDNKLTKFKELSEKRKDAPVVKGAGQNKAALTKLSRKKQKISNELIKVNKTLNSLRGELSPLVKQKFIDTIRRNKDLFKISFKSGASPSSTTDDLRDYGIIASLSLEEVDSTGTKLVDTKLAEMKTGILIEEFEESVIFKQRVLGDSREEKLSVVDNVLGSIFNVPRGTTRDRTKPFGDILFFPLRALIAAAYSDLDEEYKERVPFVGLSNVTTKVYDRDYSLNIGDILVSVDVFQRWYYENYTSKQIISYTFGDFLNDIMTKLVPHILENETSSLFGRNRIGNIRPINYLTKMTADKKDVALFRKIYVDGTDKNLLNQLAIKLKHNTDTKTTANLKTFSLYTNIKNPSNPVGSVYLKRNLKDTNFNEKKDIKFNAPHIKIGADSGLLKSINFSAQDFPGLRTALWADSLTNSAETLLKYKYSANLTTIGNNVFFRGGYFTIPSNPLGLSRDSFDPGIVGYYVIQKVTDSLTIGNYETSMQGTWIYNPQSKNIQDIQKQEGGESVLDPPPQLQLSVFGYLEDVFRVEAATLAKNGLNSDFSVKKEPPRLEQTDDNRRDIKEPV